MPVSRDTLLRELRRAGGAVAFDAPVVVGIDDWAIARRDRYGTIVVDLERRCPIEVLDGRESNDVAAWLKRHPTNQWVARDRAGAYSDATRSALPHARQVADRWHLLVNLHETVERLLHRRYARLREAAQLVADSALSLTQDSGTDATMALVGWQKLSIERRASRLARYERWYAGGPLASRSRRSGGPWASITGRCETLLRPTCSRNVRREPANPC